jgi:hypothetical protein
MIAHARLAVFLVGIILAGLSLGAQRLSAAWLLVPAALFTGLVLWHERVSRGRRRAELAAAFYEKGLARLDNRWSGSGEPGLRYLDENHPNSPDLDLFGSGSLFELLCTARTRKGEDTLADWLRSPADPEEVRARQAAVRDLGPRVNLREELALLAADVPAGVDFEGLAAWGETAPILLSRWAPLAAAVLGPLTLAALFAWMLLSIGLGPFLALGLLEGVLALWLTKRVLHVIRPVERRARELALFAGLLARIEREDFKAPSLCRLRATLNTAGWPPSRRIAQLGRLVDWLDARRNIFFAPLALLLLWTTQLAFAIDAWRSRVGPAIRHWLAVVGEFEALCALAAYAYENPDDPDPEIVPDGPCFDGEGMGHPLIPVAQCVRNDLALDSARRVLIVSGSNMSGKSTLLRTVGINTVLALAGAPVRARRLRVSPLVVGATLRIHDSLQAGRSRFYAEITRVRQLVDLAMKGPLLFLLDELLQGTNSHDRRIGAEVVVRGLVEQGAIGLLTTHDLALTHIADLLAPQVANVHFEDHFENGAMTFDYRMRPGVVQKSNALELMRSLGFKV